MATNKELAGQIAANFASKAEDPSEITALLQDTFTIFQIWDQAEKLGVDMTPEANTEETDQTSETKLEPIMDPQRAIGQDSITCLVCGKSFKTLKRHMKNAHGMTPEEYRTAFNLTTDYPIVAPSLSEKRRQVAHERGLGEKLAQARKEKQEQQQED